MLKCDFAARQRSTRLYGKAVLDLDFQGFNRKVIWFFFCSFVNNLRIQGVYSAPLKHNMSCNLSKSRYDLFHNLFEGQTLRCYFDKNSWLPDWLVITLALCQLIQRSKTVLLLPTRGPCASTLNNFVALTETVEVGCPRHPGVTTIGNQLQDGDRIDGWQNLTTQPWAPTPSIKQAPVTLIHNEKQRVGKGGNKNR